MTSWLRTANSFCFYYILACRGYFRSAGMFAIREFAGKLDE